MREELQIILRKENPPTGNMKILTYEMILHRNRKHLTSHFSYVTSARRRGKLHQPSQMLQLYSVGQSLIHVESLCNGLESPGQSYQYASY